MRLRVPTLLAASLLVMTGCSTDESTIVIVDSDCGLIRSDMTGTWQVVFDSAASRNVGNCDNAPGVATVDVSAASSKQYGGVTVFGSDESTSWVVLGDRTDAGDDPAVADELIASVEADSCLAMFRTWEPDDEAYVQCLGILDLNTHTIQAGCDSVEFDTDLDGAIEATCDLDAPGFGVDVDVF